MKRLLLGLAVVLILGGCSSKYLDRMYNRMANPSRPAPSPVMAQVDRHPQETLCRYAREDGPQETSNSKIIRLHGMGLISREELVPMFSGEVMTGMGECAMLAATSDLNMVIMPAFLGPKGQKTYRFGDESRDFATPEQRARRERVFAGKYVITVENERVAKCDVVDLSKVHSADDLKAMKSAPCPVLRVRY